MVHFLQSVRFRALSLRGSFVPLLVLAGMLVGCSVTPQPLDPRAEGAQTARELADVLKAQPPAAQALTLPEAVARTIKYNLEQRAQALELAVEQGLTHLSEWRMLPRLVATGQWQQRSSEAGSSSLSLLSGQQSLEPSTSQDRAVTSGDLGLSWDVLDFGVSYIRARQQGDRLLIAAEQRRKLMRSLVSETTRLYWRAASAQMLVREIDQLEPAIHKALANAQKIERERLQPPVEILNYQKSLLQTLDRLEKARQELASAQVELASLINHPPGQPLGLAAAQLPMAEPPPFFTDMALLEDHALAHRPELHEARYQERISAQEVRAALLSALPGVQLLLDARHSSNSFLVNNVWVEGGPRLTWNLMRLFSTPMEMSVAENRNEINSLRRLALAMSVLGQVHTSYQALHLSYRSYQTTLRIGDVESRLLEHMEAGMAAREQTELALIRQRADQVFASQRRDRSFADYQAALAVFQSSLGLDALPPDIDEQAPLEALTQAVAAAMDGRQYAPLFTDHVAVGAVPALDVARPSWSRSQVAPLPESATEDQETSVPPGPPPPREWPLLPAPRHPDDPEQDPPESALQPEPSS
ncbi:MAG: TolC family protein [Magnetococcus sp. WYHC-3]